MAKTWQNVNCTFQTLNTENNLGNSQYTITGNPNRLVRYAPVNTFRAPNQVNFDVAKSVCYLQPAGDAYKAIMGDSRDWKFSVEDVAGNDILFRYEGNILRATRQPATGWQVFDLKVTDEGTVFDTHVGHKLINLVVT